MEIIIVLGNRNHKIMKSRMDCAIEEYRRTPDSYYDMIDKKYIKCKCFLFSGGSSDGVSRPTGAEMMKEYAIQNGIKEEHIILENKSRTTVENIIETKKILEDINLIELFVPKLTICTSSSHISRALVISKFYLCYDMSFIHTNENVSINEKTRENILTINFINKYCQYLKINVS